MHDSSTFSRSQRADITSEAPGIGARIRRFFEMASAGANTALEKLAIYIIAPLLVAGIIGMVVVYGRVASLDTSVTDMQTDIREIRQMLYNERETKKPVTMPVKMSHV